jgi:regulator of replication initiation timing
MKKIITSIAALLLFVGLSSAAETSANTATAENKTNSLGAVSSRSIAAIIEENVALRIKIEEMAEESDNLQSKLGYSTMMHATISNLKQKEVETIEENKNLQLDYARMMTATLVNLSSVLANNK